MTDAHDAANASRRIAYLDNIRVFLTALVVLHHFAITYGAPGGWYYIEQPVDGMAALILWPFVAINQAYFMGFFFLLSAYLVPGSLRRKGKRRFLTDRLVRLGIPLAVYIIVLNPILDELSAVADGNATHGFWADIVDHWGTRFGAGPMWFVGFLLLLTSIYLLLPERRSSAEAKGPIRLTIANTTVFALGLGLFTFLVRTAAPIGTWVPNLVEPAHAPQYVALFWLGIVAGRRGWEEEVPRSVERYWAWILPASLLVGFAVLRISLGADGDPALALGGFGIPSLAYSVWEHLWCVGVIVLLLGIFRRRFGSQGPILQSAALDSYATYIMHPLVLVAIAILLQSLVLPALAKFLLFAPLAVFAAFAIGHLTRSLPAARRVL